MLYYWMLTSSGFTFSSFTDDLGRLDLFCKGCLDLFCKIICSFLNKFYCRIGHFSVFSKDFEGFDRFLNCWDFSCKTFCSFLNNYLCNFGPCSVIFQGIKRVKTIGPYHQDFVKSAYASLWMLSSSSYIRIKNKIFNMLDCIIFFKNHKNK